MVQISSISHGNPVTIKKLNKYSLSPELFSSAFPFHIVLDKELRVLQIGKSLEKTLPFILRGKNIADFLHLKLPSGGELSYNYIIENIKNSFILETTDKKIKLRGGFVFDKKLEKIYFLCTPWVMTAAEIEEIGLSMTDFPAHDAQYDFLLFNSIKDQNIDDLNDVTKRLKQRTTELETLNSKLDNIILEKTKYLTDALQKAASSEKKLAAILDSIEHVAIFMTNLNGDIISWNSGSKALLGLDDDILGKHFDLIFDNKKYNFNHCKDKFNFEIKLKTPGYQKRVFNLCSRKLRDEINSGFTFMLEDITQKLKFESVKSDLQKHEQLGQLTGGLAHDFNNLLGIIVASLDTLEDFILPGDGPADILNMAVHASARASDITRALLSISQRNMLIKEDHNINNIIVETMELLRASIGRQVMLTSDLCSRQLLCNIDKSFFANSLLNLVINAKHAVLNSEIKSILIKSNIAYINPENILNLSPGWYGKVSVIDTGAGIPEEIINKVREPFFTTKENKGTGLGLSMVYSFLEQVDGRGDINSVVGKGTEVALYFPLVEEFARQQEQAELNRIYSLHSLKILDTPKDERYENIVLKLSQITGAKYAFISFIDKERQWFKAIVGSDLTETSLDNSICAHAITSQNNIFLAEDLDNDPRFSGKNCLSFLGISCYYGACLTDKNGLKMGMLAIAHNDMLIIDDLQMSLLQNYAGRVMQLVYEDLSELEDKITNE